MHPRLLAINEERRGKYATSLSLLLGLTKSSYRHRVSDALIEEKQLRLMELEFLTKRMDHEERMQKMKLEQLKLEIELEKIRAASHNNNNSNSQ